MTMKYVGGITLLVGMFLTFSFYHKHETVNQGIELPNVAKIYDVDNSETTAVVRENVLQEDAYFKEIVSDEINPKIKEVLSCETDYENASWNHIDLMIDYIKIINVLDYQDSMNDSYQELISAKYHLKNDENIPKTIVTDKAELVLMDGQEVGIYTDKKELMNTQLEDGYIQFKVKQENKLKDIQALKITLHAINDETQEITHTYTIDLS